MQQDKMQQAAPALEVRLQLRHNVIELARLYVAHYQGDELEGLAALGEDVLRLADCTEGRTNWLDVLRRLQRLSG
jgi:hypothetical protein